jgi:zinc transport system ATP-binding protein
MRAETMPPEAATDDIVVRDLVVDYGTHRAIEHIDLQVRPRELLALVGPNGGGKSTLLKALLGLVPATAGQILVFGRPPRKGRTGLGYVPQSAGADLTFPLTVTDVITTGLLVGNRFWTARQLIRRNRDAVPDILERLDLTGLSRRPIGTLSGGQRQRVLIGRALVSQPRALILDEPTSQLDPRARTEIYELLAELRRQIPILIASHDVDQIDQVADRVFRVDRRLTPVLDRTRDTANGSPRTLSSGTPLPAWATS